MSLNETVVAMLADITTTGTPWWLTFLALAGLFYLLNTAAKTGVNVVYLIAYAVGAIKWLVDVAKKIVARRR